MIGCVLYQACAPLKPHLAYRYLYKYTGKPVDEPSHVDNVPSVFAYKLSLAEAVFSTLVIHFPRKRATRTTMTQQDEFLLFLMRLYTFEKD